MSARRCSPCGLNYPDVYAEFKECVKCGGKTDSLSNAHPMSDSDLKHLKFDVFWRDEWEPNRAKREMAAYETALEATPSIPDPDG